MKFIYQYPDLHGSEGDMLDAGPVADIAIAAEQAGWDGFAFTEHPAPAIHWLDGGGHQSLDPLVALAHVAAVTKRMKLLTYLAVLPYRNPLSLAKSAATVDRLSNGRLILGVGTGYLKAEFFALGVDFDERNKLFDEALDVLPLHWSGQPFDYVGTHFNCRGTVGKPAAAQQPIPIWIGGNSQLTLRRVAARAQGWMPLLGPSYMFKTTKTAAVSSDDDITSRLSTLKELARERFSEIEITIAYMDTDVHNPKGENDRHADAFGRLGELGIHNIVVSSPNDAHPAACEFAQSFADRFIN